MAKPLVSDDLWEAIEPLLLPPTPGRGHAAADLPWLTATRCAASSSFCAPGCLGTCWPRSWAAARAQPCWRRLRDWHQAGVWSALHQGLLEVLADAGQLDWSRASVDGFSVPAQKGAKKPGRIRRIAANRARSAILR